MKSCSSWEGETELWLTDKQGNKLFIEDPIKKAVELLKSGKILAIKGLGGFHLACDPFNQAVVIKLRKRKKRPDKPFALMMRDLKTVSEYSYLSPEEEGVLSGKGKVILLLERKNSQISDEISPDNNQIGIMLPYTAIQEYLFQSLKALIMTSANLSGLPLEYTDQGALSRLNKIADYFLLHNRDIKFPIDDSISRIILGKERLIRRARGYTPLVIHFPGLKESLACGSYLKNTIALAEGESIIFSQHLGDINNLENYQHYKKAVEHYKSIYQIEAEIIAHDLHPGYISSRFARAQAGRKIGIQHHHAHIVSCMVDNEIRKKVIGLAFDGSGLGTDKRIWGGEFLICDYSGFKRVGQLKYVKMPGGETAVKEPWRMALSYLYHSFGDNRELISSLIDIDQREIDKVLNYLKSDLDITETSSMGRLFDATASIIGLGNYISYQAQLAIKLENAVSQIERSFTPYSYQIENKKGFFLINILSVIREIVLDIERGIRREEIAGRFHDTVIDFSVSLCELIREKYDINTTVLSGGVFQNKIILEGIYKRLDTKGFEVYIHSRIPCNDGGLSVGQLVIANYMGH